MAQANLFSYFKKLDGNKPAAAAAGTESPKSSNNTPAKVKNEQLKKENTQSASKPKQENKENSLGSQKTPKNKTEDKASKAKKADPPRMDVDLYENDDDEDIKIKRPTEDSSKASKRKRLMILDSDEEDEVQEKPKKGKKEVESSPDVVMEEDEDSEEEVKPKKKPQNKNLNLGKVDSPKTPKTVKSTSSAAKINTPSSAAKPNLSSFAANLDSDDSNLPPEAAYKHYHYEFLKDDKIKDVNGNPKGHPDYDPRTIYVPESFKKDLTPALRQWWNLKSQNFDVIFFFKVGKFYELYHQDAVVAVKELGLTFMKGDYAHAGFPEIAYSRFADALVSKGYKVGRVEQTETPEAMTERTRGQKLDKTVRREICKITTPGTKTFNVLDGQVSNAFSHYLFSFVEKVNTVGDKKVRLFGVCFVDTSVGKIHIGQFEDDRNCSKFRTTLAHYPPAHILYERATTSKETKTIIEFQNGIKDGLANEKEMYSSSAVLRMLSEDEYFQVNGKFSWPESFKPLLSEHDTLGLTPKSEYELAVHALGGVIWCLKKCLIDNEILSMRNFEIYEPIDNISTQNVKINEFKKSFAKQKYMVLDSISLTNLEIIENIQDGSQAGTLYERLDFCNTAFGKRLLKYWLVNPLCDADGINDRLDAIEDLSKLDHVLSNVTELLKQLPDLERLISKIHQLGNVKSNHPESRAIMYENETYSKKKVEDLIAILNGFASAAKIFDCLKEHRSDFKSKLLKSITTIIQTNEAGNKLGFPYLDDLLKKYNASFDAETARKTGTIIPSTGVNESYDKAIDDIKATDVKLNKYLREQSKEFGCSLNYVGTGRNRYQMEIPENKCKSLPDDFELTSSRKGYKRYQSSLLKSLVAELTDFETKRDQALRDTMKCLFKKFDEHYNVWNRAVQCLSILDVLLSLTSYVRNSDQQMCRPEIVMLDEKGVTSPFIDIKNGRHPCVMRTFTGEFIPNDVVIGSQEAKERWQKNPLILVTGPNMGGKSTLMRQTGLTIILAQMGCFVPAESCRLSPVDRIFTRIGATDKILQGESTFFLELSETASILHHATKHSLVLMDELGRGTATFDGTAIAYSVVKELANNVKCRTLFSTHYHHLVEEFSDKDNVSMGHMECMVSDDNQSITFLYKFGEGACPKSHGFNAARLADIPDEIIKVGSVKSVEFENFTKKIQLLKKIMFSKTKKQIEDVITKFKSLTA